MKKIFSAVINERRELVEDLGEIVSRRLGYVNVVKKTRLDLNH